MISHSRKRGNALDMLRLNIFIILDDVVVKLISLYVELKYV